MSKTIGIAGAGLAGRLLALELADQGWSVSLFDADGPDATRSTTHASAGMLAPSCELERAETEISLYGMQSLPLWDRLLERFGGVSNPLVHRAMPAVFFNRLMETMRFIADRNCVGLHIDQFNIQAWPTAGPFYYLFAHLAWDPYADGDAILDDYYRRGFGPAHEQVGAYWTLMENTFEKMREEWDSWTSYYEFYDEDFFRRASGLLDEAGSALNDGAPDIYRRRLEHVRDGLEFTRHMVDTETMLARYRESQGRDTEAAGRVRENWETKIRIGEERGFHLRTLQGWKRRMLP